MSTLRILTWNIWFDSFEYACRMTSVLSIIKESNPDVICLQEVIPKFYEVISASQHQWLLETYSPSADIEINRSSIDPYGTLVLTKRALGPTKSEILPLTTEMNRYLVTTVVNNICIASVHLESLSTHLTRIKQMNEIKEYLNDYQNVVITGDFNFCSYRNYVVNSEPLNNNDLVQILHEYKDVWAELRSGEMGYTFDTETNLMLRYKQLEKMRYDRIIYKNMGSMLVVPTQIELVGTESINSALPQNTSVFNTPPTGKIIFPSDHFGLLSVFNIDTN
jgi:tyrosyl-DNA phosphodiesterase 2